MPVSHLRFDSPLEKATDAVWSTTRTLAYLDLALRGAQHFLQNAPEKSAFCAVSPSAQDLCHPRRSPSMDIYAGMTCYMGGVLAVGTALHTLHNCLRDHTDLGARWQDSRKLPQVRGTYVLPREQLGWAANGYIAAIMCGAHGWAGYSLNDSVKNSHVFRLATGCLIGAGVVLFLVSAISLVNQCLPPHLSVGRSVRKASALMPAIADLKIVCLLHMGASLLYSSLAAASEQSRKDPWRYHYWGAPILGLAATASIGTAVYLVGAGIYHHRRAGQSTVGAGPRVTIEELPDEGLVELPAEAPRHAGELALASMV